MPSVQRAHNDFKGRNIKVLTISIDAGGAADVKPFMAQNGYTMPVLLDANTEIAGKFSLIGTPATFIVDRSGLVVAGSMGPVDFDHPDFRKFINELAG